MATASLGVAVGNAGEDLSGVMARADHCLYEAKAAGRNYVVAD
jgi:PleD family two-component response regulator